MTGGKNNSVFAMHRYHHRASQALRERLLIPLRQLTGIEIFVAVAIGVVGGLFPVPLLTSLVTLLAGWYVHCNAAQLVFGSTVNLFCTPLQLALLPSFARLMGAITQGETSTFTAYALKEALAKGYASFLSSCGWMIAYAVVGWFLVFIPVVLVLRALQRCTTHREPHKESVRLTEMEEVRIGEGH
ncbi:hypothetical protein ABB37_00805 [Leptomonas pyrrhocoris]|uniref:DUF2062 domain-containing protein n=1 Tax=Leptomonas pyrrhocoris TaxID=157538 RepID=A0A0M9GB69_LEPPY|nr:hypothetical protein ABB37_00805 [Leptomonas pyrrhocoris]XP_015665156.1 hypothetical protein ABB37_00805 [Leptomonas pyrrhocoris]KPA86716.1 hypothetical protein ABB37_00805 [Leptomonas pyrrhocoris]KPA86717.1 hypothetical protein ABB37_00805 [Leptomonas pyrrhocoris]|eukprot:XP_015665155.1 hypothetical protein ABB37_00805 [Leptomonas pyrrhocoris]